MKQTPLYETHLQYGGNIIDFGGWALPVQYSSIVEEHNCVRNNVGLFDVSHMGEITVKGESALAYINNLTTNDISKLADGQITYSPICYADGGVVDDLLVYKIKDNDYLLVVNASNTDKDFAWCQENLMDGVVIENVSAAYGQIALQGPNAQTLLQTLTETDLATIKYYRFQFDGKVAGIDCIISRTGYTGESGFELYVAAAEAPALWEALMQAGKDMGILPCGLGARDTLRFEAALPLYGQEISAEITPVEAGLNRFIKTETHDFIGKQALVAQLEQGASRALVGFEMVGRGIARGHYEIYDGDTAIGMVTTGSFSPTVKKNIGMALVNSKYTALDTVFDVIIRGKHVQAKVIALPFYTKKKK